MNMKTINKLHFCIPGVYSLNVTVALYLGHRMLTFNNRFDSDQCKPVVIDRNTTERVQIWKLLGDFFLQVCLGVNMLDINITAKAKKRFFHNLSTCQK